MAEITLQGDPINTVGFLPPVGEQAPNFNLVAADLSDRKLSDFRGKKVVLNIFPSIDTDVCATSVRKFNEEASSRDDTVVLCISADLPFAAGRFCGAEGLDDVVTLSVFRNPTFGDEYGMRIVDGPIAGLLGRAVLVVDEQGTVIYAELVPEIAQEPNYFAAMQALDG